MYLITPGSAVCMLVICEVIEAMGGELKITAKFPDVEVTITN
ncbi:MAG: hypothetical protein ACKN9K_20775 [Dolichospermum sp.]